MAGVCTGPGPCDIVPIGPGKNWVNSVGGLPLYIRAIAQALIRNGHSESEAIQLAVGTVKRWSAGGGKVTPATKARAIAALAEWEAKKAEAHASADRSTMADREGIELARVGEWQLSTGPLSVTAAMLNDAATRAATAGNGYRAPLRLGHNDERFDGEPAVGWLHNLRVEGDGDDAVLKGDVTGMPEWLAEVEPTAYPDRSVEALVHAGADGAANGFEVTGLALLGVTPPGMSTIRSLRDIPQALGVKNAPQPIAASFKATADTVLAASGVSMKPWSDFSQADYTPEQWKAACLIVKGDGSTKAQCSLPVKEPDGTLNANGVRAAAGRIHQVDAPAAAKTAAAKTLVGYYRGPLNATPPASLLSFAGIKAAGTQTADEPSVQPPTPKEAGSMPDTEIKGLRERLGLPEDADQATVDAKVDELLELATKPDEKPEVKPDVPVVPEGKLLVDADQWDDMKVAAAAGAEARKVQLVQERDTTIERAFREGKISASAKPKWVTRWDRDAETTAKDIDDLPVVFPVAAAGYVGSSDVVDDEDKLYEQFFGKTETQKVGA